MRHFCAFLLLSFCIIPLFSQTPKQQYAYVLHTIARLDLDKNWTPEDGAIAEKHFLRLQEMTKQGVVILAARAMNEGPTRFGIVIFEAENEEKAREFMNADPAIAEGIMTGELFPFAVALQREPVKAN